MSFIKEGLSKLKVRVVQTHSEQCASASRLRDEHAPRLRPQAVQKAFSSAKLGLNSINSKSGSDGDLSSRALGKRNSHRSSSAALSSQRSSSNNSTNWATPPTSISDSEPGSQPPMSANAKGKRPVTEIRDFRANSRSDQEAPDAIAYYDNSPLARVLSHNIPLLGFSSSKSERGEREAPLDIKDRNSQDAIGATPMRGLLSHQDLSKQLADFHAEVLELQRQDEARREKRQAVEHAIRQEAEEARKRAEERARQEEEDRRQAEEIARIEAEQEEARLAAALARLRDCVVCGDAKDPLDFPARPPARDCEHPSQTCSDCLQLWIASEFDAKGCDGIRCPQCPAPLDYGEVQHVASAETFLAFDKLATSIALGTLDEFSWCLKAGCGSGQMNTNNMNFMDCASCGYKQCIKHKSPWHAGETCSQYEYRVSGQKAQDEEKKTEEMLDGISKKCPNPACGWRIQKIDGCEHMTCRRCKHEFCWLCLAAHTEIKRIGNTAHTKDCKFHSDNLTPGWPFNVH